MFEKIISDLRECADLNYCPNCGAKMEEDGNVVENAPAHLVDKTGQWTRDPEGGTYCGQCKHYIPTVSGYTVYEDGEVSDWEREIEPTKYCPHCGVRMRDDVINEDTNDTYLDAQKDNEGSDEI